jgi:hypothetical protein
MFINDGFAVLIGVDDYSAFDASRALPAGTSGLAGSLNDVRVWWKQCRLLGLAPAQIRVLTSPVIDFSELEGATSENVGPATEAEIRATVSWLAEKLGQPSQPSGLLTYSGHGDWIEGRGPVLCPSDVAFVDGAAAMTHAISYADLGALLGQAWDNLTVVLDCCHTSGAPDGEGLAQGGGNTGRPLSLTRRAAPKGSALPAHAMQLPGRVLSASQRAQPACQSKFDGVDRGAFSWSLTSALEQWRAVQAGGGVRLDVSYGKLVEASRRVLEALWFPQAPALYGPPGLASLAVFQQGLTPKPGQTTRRPDGPRQMCQLDGGNDIWRIYTLTFNDPYSTPFATVIIVNTTQFSGYATGKEYWYINTDSVSLIGTHDFEVAYTDNGSSPAPAAPKYSVMQSFTLVESPGWTSYTTDPAVDGYLYTWGEGIGATPIYYLRINFQTRTSNVGKLTWYQLLPSGSATNLSPSGTLTDTTDSAVTVPSGYTGYYISQTV